MDTTTLAAPPIASTRSVSPTWRRFRDAFRRHPHATAQQLFTETDLGEVGTLPAVRMPGLSPGAVPRPAPAIGQDSRTVLADWGVASNEAEAWFACGAAQQGPSASSP